MSHFLLHLYYRLIYQGLNPFFEIFVYFLFLLIRTKYCGKEKPLAHDMDFKILLIKSIILYDKTRRLFLPV